MRKSAIAVKLAALAAVCAGAAHGQPQAEERGLGPATGRGPGGCWIEFYNRENFEGVQYTYFGPTNVRNLWNFVDRPGSVSVGPNARVVLYADAAFRDHAITLDPNQRVADLPERTDDVHVTFGSMKIRCP